ncbi:ABC transporter ATP-binding protein [Aquamicrobium sp. LC103]|uniref:ABC transporter ATP-binding protein n=1 Tax=Aquamicrobium sp. LC103 TaxID=1120658 RepID=UPI00063E7A58|nr:ABC transporter ATP-binding protein [Aquamicrobium sp. LC103]TKT74177.1 ABC transporter ATP-binding protein [Aquamicrobium sp. LC103]
MSNASLSLEGISAFHDSNKVLDNLNIDVAAGELVSLLGASGCGKTTTLRVIAGFMQPSQGRVVLGGRELTHLPVHRRDIGLVFQNYALLPHLTVVDNVMFGLKQRGVSSSERRRKAMEMIEIVGLSRFVDRLPAALSGGQKQRVALARALVIDPPLMMFDEPLSNLDAKLRVDMRVQIRRLQTAGERTAVYVTHDQEEAFSISDRVAIMDAGRIVQLDAPEVLYKRPVNAFVARFVGFENIVPIEVVGRDGGDATVRLGKDTRIAMSEKDFGPIPDKALLATRPEGLQLGGEPGRAIPATLGLRTYLGRAYQYHCASDAGTLLAHGDVEKPQAPDQTAHLAINPAQSAILPYETPAASQEDA